MTTLALDWNKGAPAELEAGMVVRTARATLLIGDGPRPIQRSKVIEWAWLAQPYELEWLADMRRQHAKGRPEQ
nr:hypothetical protein [Pseudomonas sp. UBA6718]